MPTESLRTRGAEETAAALSTVYGRVQITSADPGVAMRLERDRAGPVTLDRIGLDLDLDTRFDVDPQDLVIVARVRQGTLRIGTGQTTEFAGPGELVAPGTDHGFRARVEALDEDSTALPNPLLAEAAATLRDPEVDPVRLTGQRPVSARAVAGFNQLRGHALQALRDVAERPAGDATSLVTSSVHRLLACGVLATFPNTAVTEPTPTDRSDAHPDTLRRAIAFVESNPDLDITLTDIARAAYVTPRALQLAFRRHLDTTPMRYLRRIRLDRAHADLTAATPEDGTTVTAIAARWGYGRPSGFAAAYRITYGHHPYQTLHDATGPCTS